MKFLYRVYPLLAVPNYVQDGTRYLPNGAAETLRHQKVNARSLHYLDFTTIILAGSSSAICRLSITRALTSFPRGNLLRRSVP